MLVFFVSGPTADRGLVTEQEFQHNLRICWLAQAAEIALFFSGIIHSLAKTISKTFEPTRSKGNLRLCTAVYVCDLMQTQEELKEQVTSNLNGFSLGPFHLRSDGGL